MWINPQMKVVHSRCTASSCFSDICKKTPTQTAASCCSSLVKCRHSKHWVLSFCRHKHSWKMSPRLIKDIRSPTPSASPDRKGVSGNDSVFSRIKRYFSDQFIQSVHFRVKCYCRIYISCIILSVTESSCFCCVSENSLNNLSLTDQKPKIANLWIKFSFNIKSK